MSKLILPDRLISDDPNFELQMVVKQDDGSLLAIHGKGRVDAQYRIAELGNKVGEHNVLSGDRLLEFKAIFRKGVSELVLKQAVPKQADDAAPGDNPPALKLAANDVDVEPQEQPQNVPQEETPQERPQDKNGKVRTLADLCETLLSQCHGKSLPQEMFPTLGAIQEYLARRADTLQG